ncbi:MAG: tRNA (adenosine(37)-N6)-dimethylallyltransferase MiaA [Salana multivorans]|uniref:tRNA (adenosine(37)-N6)-dimethylallyltransferase MiaA n=1 Tax=Salana multivorans TaxID=120377 RepID=UPI00096489DA|nr:tRNA (adenosine(37)-N6)-dimethylallyltransferase MiaA [Salana multivorans]MBN8882698.1 tRNA (adenosine(37)-N6)-dimethylallyltransferase MiaA [Salana multivorans]OJX95625.1 MAG: tRNA (adenosine(37)-N6)-dimethylallyltransferase MiaA [Micrococcales bacterium 73-15]
MPTTPPVLAVVGPTASGKSRLAIELARRLGGELVNADAMQVYRGMDIGTAKTPPEERGGVPHHLLDVLDVREDASVAWYQTAAAETLAAIGRRGNVPVLAGGSGLYLRSVLDVLDFPATDPDVRARWEAIGAEEGPGLLHERLLRLDPAAAERIGSRNTRRLVRALEVIELTGRPYTATLPQYAYARPALQVALGVPREVLVERIAARAERMFADGLVEETARLRAAGLEAGVTASRAVGYVQALAVLDGELDVAAAIEATAIATRQVARRQTGWFGRDPRIVWLDGQAGLETQVEEALAAWAALTAPAPSARPRTLDA